MPGAFMLSAQSGRSKQNNKTKKVNFEEDSKGNKEPIDSKIPKKSSNKREVYSKSHNRLF